MTGHSYHIWLILPLSRLYAMFELAYHDPPIQHDCRPSVPAPSSLRPAEFFIPAPLTP